MNYKASRDIPQFARELRSLSPSKIADRILNRRNVERTPESVTMWFKDHLNEFEELKKELVGALPTEKQAVDSSMFQDGNFQEVPSVKEWILFMRTRRRKGKDLHPVYITRQVQILRNVCERFSKHPDRLTLHDVQEVFMALEKDESFTHWENNEKVKGKDTNQERRALKDFLKSKGVSGWEKIGVGKPSGYGQYKELHVEKEVVQAMLEYIKTRDFRVYVVDKIMYHNGLRLNAVVNSKIEGFKADGEWDTLTVLEKFRERKTFMVIREVGDLIRQVIGERKEGSIFERVALDNRVGEVNREALKRFVPELEPKIEMPNHFFRHMCAQHLLRASKWNSKAVAAMMQCSEQSLNESYGGAPQGKQREWCEQYLPLLS
ncbi:tyrosine-type recombinase/integrase [Candidatus Bathyarchaeota archaeon]|nr:tyrosine-type recombinase/integrase [Candidatus Bathyarchaeota archaeon]